MAKTNTRYISYRTRRGFRYSRNFNSWIAAQATRLTITQDAVFAQMKAGKSVFEIESTPTPGPP